MLCVLMTGVPVFAQAIDSAAERPGTVLAPNGEKATDAEKYLDLLVRIGTPLSPEEASGLQKYLAQLALILPAQVRNQVATGDWEAGTAPARLAADAGEVLLLWWRSQDPLPASASNERLEEHLRRVEHAETIYSADNASGFDDRGKIYVRYGEPTRQKEITFTDPKLIDTVYQPGLSVSPSDFPDNAFWIYRDFSGTVYYIFVEKDGYFRQAETLDLLPRKLQNGFSSGRLGQVRAQMTLAVLRSVYRQLAVEHPDFGARYDAIDNFASIQEVEQMVGDERPGSNILEDTGFEATVFDLSPGDFVQTIIGQGHSEDGQAIWKRESTRPQQVTGVFRDRSLMPVSVRTARFLDDDGSTRTEIYWGPQPGGLRFSRKQKEEGPSADPWSPNEFVITLTAVQQSLDYQSLAASQKPYLITDLPSVQDAAIPAQTMTVVGDTGRYHLALQWDQYRALLREAGEVQLGPQVQIATHRVDSLLALNPDERRLEMSDLKPLVIRDVTALADNQKGAEAYPHRDIWSDLPLGFYFEVYHLTFGADDQAHYTVTYEIVRDKERSSLLRFLGRGGEERTSVSTTYTGTSRTAREYILLDLSEWEGQGELKVRVRVKDETTGQQISRVLSFMMNP